MAGPRGDFAVQDKPAIIQPVTSATPYDHSDCVWLHNVVLLGGNLLHGDTYDSTTFEPAQTGQLL